MAKVAKTADRSKMMDTSKGIECPKCNKATRIVKRVKDRERSSRRRLHLLLGLRFLREALDRRNSGLHLRLYRSCRR